MNFRYINPHNVRWFIPSWAIDPFELAKTMEGMIAAYAARVICGHSGRLTAEQVRQIRLMSIAGHGPSAIAQGVGDNERRVQSVLDGKRYARVV